MYLLRRLQTADAVVATSNDDDQSAAGYRIPTVLYHFTTVII